MDAEREYDPVTSTKGMAIVQAGIVVEDAAKTARRYTEFFGLGPWLFFDMIPTEIILHDEPLGNVESCVRVALADLGGIQIELLQPLYGPGTHMEFWKERGEGIHHLSFGAVNEHDRMVAALKEQGIGIEMQGLLGGAATFTYLATQKELGTIFEIVKPAAPGKRAALKPWGTYPAHGPGIADLEGRRIAQVGIEVNDAKAKARRYWEIFGMGPWSFIDFQPPYFKGRVLHDIPMSEEGSRVIGAIAKHENLQLELLQPVSGAGTHMEYLKTKGEGVHHLSFGVVDDHDRTVSAFGEMGVGIEMSGILGGATWFTYLESQKDLGTVFELVKSDPEAESTLEIYGTYPPSR
jgi:catechol 2,3-dioxygenase-like lactoylglutathione lyase family enzyme